MRPLPLTSPATPDPTSTGPRGALVLMWLLYGLNAALFPFAALIVDSGRDLANGLALALGGTLPAYGPSLFGIWHLGPAWYALLALPLWLGGSVGATALFVGLLAALKIPLAFALGRRLGDRALGLLCAAFAAMPGWQSLGSMVLSHTALVEALAFATLLASLCAVQRRAPGFAALAALLLALALHAHPTTLVLAPAVAWAWWHGSAGRRLPWLFAALLAFALPFTPALVAEARSGWPQLAGSGAYLGESDLGQRLQRIPAVLMGVAWNGSTFVREFLLQRVPGLGWLWQIGIGLVWLAALAGVVAGWRARAWRGLGALCAWLGAVVFVCLLRDATPAWMTYALAPLLALFWGLGVWTLLHRATHRGRAALVALLAALPVGAALLGDRMAVRREGVQGVPGAAVADVAIRVAPEAATRFWLSALDHDGLARRLCDGAAPIALHGDLAAAVDFAQGVATRLHCTPANTPLLGGDDAVQHLAGIPHAVASMLGITAEPAWGFVLRAPARVLFPATGRPATLDTAYRVDRFAAFAKHGERGIEVEATCTIGELLVVTNRLPGLNPLDANATRGALTLAPRLSQLASRYYDCDGAPIRLRLDTLDPGAIDVFVLAR